MRQERIPYIFLLTSWFLFIWFRHLVQKKGIATIAISSGRFDDSFLLCLHNKSIEAFYFPLEISPPTPMLSQYEPAKVRQDRQVFVNHRYLVIRRRYYLQRISRWSHIDKRWRLKSHLVEYNEENEFLE